MKLSIKKFSIWLRNYFGFSKTETNAIRILFPALTILFLVYAIMGHRIAWWPNTFNSDKLLLDSIYASLNYSLLHKTDPDSSVILPIKQLMVSHRFDPNTVDLNWTKANGIPPSVAVKWVNFLKSGGRFKKPSDLLRIYGMTPEIYDDIQEFIHIPGNETGNSQRYRKTSIQKREPADLNMTDTTALKRVRGIGSVLAKRIIKFREALGGFISVGQLYEVYHLDSAVVKRMESSFYISGDFLPEQLSVNTDSLEYLAKHPYLSFQEARIIIAYRKQHGDFEDLNTLLSIPMIDSNKLSKLRPYLRVDIE